MTKTTAASLAVLAGVCSSAADAPPQADITNGLVRARLYLPDAKTGYYRGTRFDWSGVIGSLEYEGHNFFPQWFQRTDLKVHDFIYDGSDIIAGPCTAITGPSEEFSTDRQALGYTDAKPGGAFLKIGVGFLRKPDDKPYDPYRLYELVDGGKWIMQMHPEAVDFRQEISDAATGYAYDYAKRVSLAQGKPRLVLDHTLRNRGKQVLRTSVYNHNFLYLDQQPPGPEVTITFAFPVQPEPAPDPKLAHVQDHQIWFNKTLQGEDRVYMALRGFGSDPKDYDVRIEDRRAGVGVRITGDRPLSRAALWSIRAPLSVEPFIDMTIEPGGEFRWRIQYDFYSLTANSK